MSSIALMEKAVDSAGLARTSATGPYAVSMEDVTAMNTAKDLKALSGFGGVFELAKSLGSDATCGLTSGDKEDEASADAHRAAFGQNTYPVTPPKAFFAIVWEGLHDPIIIILICAALVSTVLGVAVKSQRITGGWIDGVAIWVAVAIVACVGAANDYQKDKQFRKLNGERDVFEVKVVRDGQQRLVFNTQVVVGDVLVLDAGDKVIADGVCISVSSLVVDEASLTGESEPMHKNVVGDMIGGSSGDDPWVRSGTQVTEGSGRVLVVAVGVASEWGTTLLLLEEAEEENTPLQDKLEVVASIIGKIGVGVAIICFVGLTIEWAVRNHGFPLSKINDNGPIEFFLFGVTIIVVAVPEGLPLAVTISLAYSMKKMLKDNNFVKVLAACETMGGATTICSDKTGTLTQNRMAVTMGWFSGKMLKECPAMSDLKGELLEELKLNISLNSSAFKNPDAKGQGTEFVGSRTESALLMMLQKWGMDFETVRQEVHTKRVYGFTSDRKMSSCLVEFPDKLRLYNKGAAEWVLQRCKSMFNEYGDVVPLDEAGQKALQTTITNMAKTGLRCIALAHTDYPITDTDRADDFFENADNVDQNLCVSCIVGIKDPLRPEVPEAVAICQRAGIIVRMVTGDNEHTAEHIARECGILYGDCITLTGPKFRSMPANDLLPLLPKLRVLARSSPKDKLELVKLLKTQGEVVAVTGDGTNDAPALKESDVGLAMGIAGTEVAKEACDIIIMDDNFSSIVKSVLWGRSVFNNIRKFLQFQLTVNCVALIISFIGAVVGGDEPLNVLELLWVNLIMDTMGALALATEEPHPDLLLMQPNGRTEQLITNCMWKHIVIQSMYQLLWLLLFIFALPKMGFTRYTAVPNTQFYADQCVPLVMAHNALDTPTATYVCNGLEQCGFPLGAQQQADDCWLYRDYWSKQGLPVPNDMRKAFCGVNSTATTDCAAYATAKSARDWMLVKVTKQHALALKNSLSVLFNAFIWMQVFNEICARRINDEYTIFESFFNNPIFISVLLITVVLQTIIMEFIGNFFKVAPLTGYEWLVTIGIGAGTIPVSLFTRFASRAMTRSRVRPAAGNKHAPGSHTTVHVRPTSPLTSGGQGSFR